MDESAATDLRQARLGVLAAVMEGDSGLAFDMINELMAGGLSFDAMLFDIIAPLQADIGRRWQQGDFAIADEHASTGAIETLIAMLSGSLQQSADADHVVVACAQGDFHSLPARMVAAYLLYLGYRVTFLGSSVPALDLAEYLAETKPAALALSCAMATSLPGARDCIRVAHDAGVPVIAGGRGFADAARARRFGADGWAGTPRQLDEILRTWQPEIGVAEAEALGRSEESVALEAAADRILVEARDLASGMLGESMSLGRIAADLRVLVDAVVAAVTAQEVEIVHEYARWHSELRAQTHAGYEATPILLTALQDAIGERSRLAVQYLDAALTSLS